MHIEGAVIREQGVTFAVTVVKRHIVDNPQAAEQAILSLSRLFPGIPIVLMAQDAFGRPTYYGRSDLTSFMSSVPLEAVPWKRYTFTP
jgi:hypothetical protein